MALWIRTLVAPSDLSIALAISRLSMPSANLMTSASRRSSGSFSMFSMTARNSSLPSTTSSVECLADGGSMLSSGVAMEVRGEVVRDPDQPGPERPSVRFLAGPRKMPVGLQKCLLGQVLGVVMVADPVVRVRIDIPEMIAVELLEFAIDFGLVVHPTTLHSMAGSEGP